MADNSERNRVEALELIRRATALITGGGNPTLSSSQVPQSGAGISSVSESSNLPRNDLPFVVRSTPASSPHGIVNQGMQALHSRFHAVPPPATVTGVTRDWQPTSTRAPLHGSGLTSLWRPGLGNQSPPVSIPTNGPYQSTSVLSEMRQQFSPYQQTRRHTSDRRSLSARAVRSSLVQQVFCLGGPSDILTPSLRRKEDLISNNYGYSSITIDRGATQNEVAQAVLEAFPQLVGTEFELLRAVGQGQGKQLIKISRSSVPLPSEISAARVSTVYIRPKTEIGALMYRPVGATVENSLLPRNPVSSEISDISGSAHGGFSFISTDDLDQCATLAEYRDLLYRKYPGYQAINVASRENFLEELLGIYKDPSFDYKKKTKVFFGAENGRDVDGLSREYFSLGAQAFKSGKVNNHPLFEGQPDHLLPSCDFSLLGSGYFKLFGKFIGHSAVHSGIGFIGFSNAALQYIFKRCSDSEFFTDIGVTDIPDLDDRYIMETLIGWCNGTQPSTEVMDRTRKALISSGIIEEPQQENLMRIAQQFLYCCVIHRRATFLNEIRDGLKEVGFLEFFQQRDYLIPLVFPLEATLRYRPSDVLTCIRYGGAPHDLAKETIEDFIQMLNADAIRSLLQCWTSQPIIPTDGLIVDVIADGDFRFFTCFNQLQIPACMLREDIWAHLSLAVDHPFGFGLV